jgi:F0F1-type ATP synthase assembly protein I
MIAVQKISPRQYRSFTTVLVLSVWGMGMVIGSLIFLYIGHFLDGILGTQPHFMLGLFILMVFIGNVRLYREAKARIKDL